jgi:ribosomal protein L40E
MVGETTQLVKRFRSLRFPVVGGGGGIFGMATQGLPIQVCPRCGSAMLDIKGSRMAVCRRCGYKDDCC